MYESWRYNQETGALELTENSDQYEECADCKGSMRLAGHTDHYDD
jgi:hypothetical protein